MRGVALSLTILTGFTGLVYEVAWQKLLATLLGSHSEATAAVLSIFLGGLAVGYVVFGSVSERLARRGRPVLRVYGGIEIAIGIYAFLLPPLFAGARGISLWLPESAGALSFGFDVLLAAALIGPPAVGMGATIPLLTQGLARGLDDATRLHALVYAANTAGAFAGALCAGFVLVPWLGLQGSVLAMGVLNLAAGASFVVLGRGRAAPAPSVDAASPAEKRPAVPGLAVYASVAALVGFAMMTLQTAMNRVGALSLGASDFTFAMVVAAFVLCIAVGSTAVAALPRVRPGALALTQWALVAYLVALYPHVDEAPYWAHRIRLVFTSSPLAFHPYHVAVLVSLLAVSFVPLALSGATLPLLFHQLRRETADLGGVAGRLYAWNTAGSVAGALVGGYLLFFWLDLDQIYRLAAGALALGAFLVTLRLAGRARPIAVAALGASVAALVLAPAWSPKQLSSGLFRMHFATQHPYTGPDAFFEQYRASWGDYVLFYDDDPSTSVAVFETGGEGETARSIVVNGKSDGNIPDDNLTQGMLALLPSVLSDRAERAFLVGYGTGMTVGELAALESMREVVVAEISPGVIDAAPLFEAMNRGALASPKTRVVRSDAYRALLRSRGAFDVIVSEPSNPWVTGVEMLYSREFLRAARARLAPGGVYAQWFHTYEADEASIALVLKTFRDAFDEVAVWSTLSRDLIVLGFARDGRPLDLDAVATRFHRADFRGQFEAIGLGSFGAFLAHEVLPAGVLHASELPGKVHTLLHPVLSHAAARAFFAGGAGELPPTHGRDAAAVGARSSLVRRTRARLPESQVDAFRGEVLLETCGYDLDLCATLFAEWQHEAPASPALADFLARARSSRRPGVAEAVAPGIVDQLTELFGGLDASVPATYEVARDVTDAFSRYYHHAAPFHLDAVREPWRRCAGDRRCAETLDEIDRVGVMRPVAAAR